MNNDGKIQVSEAVALKGIYLSNDSLHDLSGLEAFTSLKSLYYYSGSIENFELKIPSLTYLQIRKSFAKVDLSGLPQLDTLEWYGANRLTYVDLSQNKKLSSAHLSFDGTTLSTPTEVNTSGLTELKDLVYDRINISKVNVSGNPNLRSLECYSAQIENIDLSYNPLLEKAYLYSVPIKTIDLSNNTALSVLMVRSTLITDIDLSKNVSLTWLDISNNKIPTVDLSKNSKLQNLFCNQNLLTELDLAANPELKELDFSHNNISHLNVDQIPNIVSLDISSNNIAALDLTKFPQLTKLSSSSNPLGSLDLSQNPLLNSLYCKKNNLSTLDLSNQKQLYSLACDTNNLTSLNLVPTQVMEFSGRYNPNLKEICINSLQSEYIKFRYSYRLEGGGSSRSRWYDDQGVIYNTNCSAIATGLESDGIEPVYTNKIVIKKYNIQGQEMTGNDEGQGVIIIKYSDGSTQKVIK